MVCASPTAFTLADMRAWWDRILESFADYIAVYGWADPTSSTPPTWIDDPHWDRCDDDTDVPIMGDAPATASQVVLGHVGEGRVTATRRGRCRSTQRRP